MAAPESPTLGMPVIPQTRNVSNGQKAGRALKFHHLQSLLRTAPNVPARDQAVQS
jgi:hypothetical protein